MVLPAMEWRESAVRKVLARMGLLMGEASEGCGHVPHGYGWCVDCAFDVVQEAVEANPYLLAA